MLTASLLILASFVVLFIGAELLVRGGAAMALKLGLSPLVVGLTVVAYGTSMPELIVSLKAAFAGQPDIAIGNVVGSNIFNIAVILGLAAAVYPIRTHLQVLRWDAPLLLGVTLLVPLSFIDGQVSRIEGCIFVLAAVAFTIWTIRAARRDENSGVEIAADTPEVKPTGSLPGDILKILAGLGVLVLGSKLLVDNAVTVASSLGVSEAVIGLTIIAAGTSMPELATSVVAAFRRQSDIALGNVLGSNLFNLLFVLGGSAVIHPVETSAMSKIDLGMMIGVTALLVPLLATGKRLNRAEGLLLAATYGGYLFVLWPKG
ncbi:calcium/sodium antiporter [Luteolibacter marinus]|uniref:calcium/sodium antiporter n=1 Tax=Luteolibacter marinus TaxID=2776705 RepID=UPI001867E79B|nr:calcium/sodium antiporter [Luteolibacter marinus]